MSDALRRWLELQRDLGGDEVIFDRPVDVSAALGRPAAASSTPPARVAEIDAPRRSPPAPAVADALVVPVVATPPLLSSEEKSDWRKGAPPIPGPGLTIISRSPTGTPEWESLEAIAAVVSGCPLCPLCRTRTHTVPGEGNPHARLMLVGEGPGESEDLSGRPFVGRAGVLLDKILESVEMPRADTFIANVVKCRPPGNRAPLPDEREACMPYLRRQVALVQPKVLLALGSTAAEALLGVKRSLGDLRLRVHRWNDIPLVVTYHPAALLRNPNWKRPAWDDIRIARQLVDRSA